MPVNVLANLGDIREYATFLLESELGDDFWPSSVLNAFIAAEHTQLVSTVHRQHEHYFSKPTRHDIEANAESYALPLDFRGVRLLERLEAGSTNKWRSIDPLERIESKGQYWRHEGVSLSGGNTGGPYPAQGEFFYIQRKVLYLVPFFNENVAGGLRLWYDYSPAQPVDDTWVPFDATLLDHHEILAVGAAIRAKKREEVPEQWSDLYQVLYARLIGETENRQTMQRRHGRNLSGYYQNG